MKEFDENESHHQLYIHLLWSTIDQKPLITPSVVPQLYNYLCNLSLEDGCHLIGGSIFCDHVQLVIKFSPESIVSDLILNLKVASSLWLRTNFPEFKNFEWQKSEFGFTIDTNEVGPLIERIKKAKSFKEEVIPMLDLCQMEYDAVGILE